MNKFSHHIKWVVSRTVNLFPPTGSLAFSAPNARYGGWHMTTGGIFRRVRPAFYKGNKMINDWWNDAIELSKHRIECYYNSLDDFVIFRMISADNKTYLQQRVSIYELEKGRFGPKQLMEGFDYLDRTRPDYRHNGPTNEDLKNPAVRNAWEEFQIVLRLAGR